MAYNNDTKMMTAPVSIKDLQQCFGLSDTDLGTLITKANINQWSLHKPTRQYALSYLSETDIIIKRQWWNGVSDGGVIFYNMRITGVRAGDTDHLGLLSMSFNFTYVKPTGGTFGTGFPYRLDDFDGYCHDGIYNVTNSRYPARIDSYTAEQYRGGTVSYTIDLGFVESGALVSLLDALATYHLGWAFAVAGTGTSRQEENGYEFLFVTSSKQLNEITIGQTVRDSNISIYRASQYTLSVTATLDSSVFLSSWVGKSVIVLPIFSNGVFNYTMSGDGSAMIYPFKLDMNFPNGQTSFNLNASSAVIANYKRPTVVFYSTPATTIQTDGVTITVGNFAFRATNNSGGRTYTVSVTQIDVSILRYIASVPTTVYYGAGDGSQTMNYSMTTGSASGSTSNVLTISTGVSAKASGTLHRRQAVVSVTLRCNKVTSGTAQYDTWTIQTVVDVDTTD